MAFLYNPKIQARANRGVGEIIPAEKGEAAGQTYKKGELVYLVAGELTICGADPALIAGIALTDASGTQATAASFEPIYPNDEVEMYANTTITTAMHGVGYGVAVGSNIWKVDISDTTNKRVVVKRLLKDGLGALDTSKFVVTFDPDNLQFNGA